MDSDGPEAYLGLDAVVDFGRPEIGELADDLRSRQPDNVEFARAAFEHVRDNIRHSWDLQDTRVSISASDTLAHGTGSASPRPTCWPPFFDARAYPPVSAISD
jgi:transglutaminase-like putative cysteine protease